MANQLSRNKTRVNLALPNDLIKRIDGRAAEEKSTRTAIMIAAAEAYLADGQAEDPSAAKLETILAKLDGLASGQAAIAAAQNALKSEQLAQATAIVDAVRNQPISVQRPVELPEPEVTDADIRKYIGKHCPDVELVGLFGDEIKLRKKGFFSRFSSKP